MQVVLSGILFSQKKKKKSQVVYYKNWIMGHNWKHASKEVLSFKILFIKKNLLNLQNKRVQKTLSNIRISGENLRYIIYDRF